MLAAVEGYYDGTTIRLPEDFRAKINQKVIVTLMNEFVRPDADVKKKSARGVLSQYANPKLREQEEGAWERAVVEKYGHS